MGKNLISPTGFICLLLLIGLGRAPLGRAEGDMAAPEPSPDAVETAPLADAESPPPEEPISEEESHEGDDPPEGDEPSEEAVPADPEELKAEAERNARQLSDQRGDAEEEVLAEMLDVKRAIAEQEQVEVVKPPPEVGPPEPPPKRKKVFPVAFYTSLRLNLVDTDDGPRLTDGASRIGALLDRRLGEKDKIFGRLEAGFNLVDELSFLVTPDASFQDGDTGTTLTPRLYYIGYDYDGLRALYGKNWSVYYDVAGRADAFAVYGGTAAGVYNAGTDGGGSGTGRADNVIQLRNRNRKWRIGVQVQNDTQIPTFEAEHFSYAVGASMRYTLESGIGIGLAGVLADPEEVTPSMQEKGFRGRDQALAASLNYQYGHWYLASVLASMRNHETDDQHQFFHAWGWETYLRYDLSSALRGVGGWNVLRPHEDEGYTGSYRVEDYLLGLQYTFGDRTFDDMVYVEYRFAQGRDSAGDGFKDNAAVGLRWRWVW